MMNFSPTVRTAALAALLAAAIAVPARAGAPAPADPAAEELRKEVAGKGWIIIAAYADEVKAQRLLADDNPGQADLYLMRPDGSEMRNITNTADTHEFFPQFSPDGRKIMFRRLPKDRDIEHDSVGALGSLVIAASDGSNPVACGRNREFPWATWSPDTKEIACLYQSENVIRIFNVETKKQVAEMPSQGIFQQMHWSPDGKSICGTAKVKGESWNIVAIDIKTRDVKVLTRYFNCTPNWFHAGAAVVNSCRNPAWGRKGGDGKPYGNTVLVQAALADGTPALLYADIDAHIYNGFTSPDVKYVAFHTGMSEGGTKGDPKKHRCLLIIRRADTPIIQPGFDQLKGLYPGAKTGPVLQPRFPAGSPIVTVFVSGDWTYADIGAGK